MKSFGAGCFLVSFGAYTNGAVCRARLSFRSSFARSHGRGWMNGQ